MTSQQRKYRPPAPTAEEILLDRPTIFDVASSPTQHVEEAQSLTLPNHTNYRPPEARPTLVERGSSSGPINREQMEAQHSSSQHSIYALLASTPKPVLADRLEKFNITPPTAQELSEFQRSIDQECLLRSLNPSASPTVSTGTIVQITLYLSGPLLKWSDPQSGRFRDVQLRALVAAFALLHHGGLTELTAEPHDQLRTNIAARFNDIIDGKKASQTSLEDRMRKADALYLIRLAAQYFSLIRRAQPLSDAIPIPILGLALAGASVVSGQYNVLSSVFRYADQVIGLIPGRRSRYLNLPAIQELTRNATSILAIAATEDPTDMILEEEGVATEAVQLVEQLFRIHVQDIPSRKSSTWDWSLARLRQGPPLMDKWYFFYGLLDCVAQLARHVRPRQISRELLSTLKQLMEKSEYEEFRWKIIEIFEAYEPVRRNIHQWLAASHEASNYDSAGILAEHTAVRTISRQNVLADFIIGNPVSRQTTSSSDIDNHRSLSENAGSTSQGVENRPLYSALVEAQWQGGLPTNSSLLAPLDSNAGRNVNASGRFPTTDESVLTNSTDERGRSRSLASQQQSYTPATEEDEDEDLEEYMEGDPGYWPQDGNVQKSQLLPPKGLFGRGSRGYTHAGLSANCRLAFFSNSKEVYVTHVSLENRVRRREAMVPEWRPGNTSRIADVVLSDAILFLSTQDNLEMHRVGHTGEVKRVSHDEWDPSGIASCEQRSGVMVAVGHRRETDLCRQGRVILHQVRIRHEGLLQNRVVRVFRLPRGNYPKALAFDRDGTILTCITDPANTVVIWNIDEEMSEDEGFSIIAGHQHRPARNTESGIPCLMS
ncbi:MAG: hypothetical protein Q9171_003490 [Xanthocarpia ochracea]